MEIGLYYRSPFETGGVEKTMLERGRLLAKLGHDITFIYGCKKPQLNMLEQYAKIGNVRHQDYVKDLDVIIYDSIYSNKMIPAQKTIQVINGNVIDGQETLSNYNADLFVSVSKDCQKQLKDKYNIDSVVIPNTINEEQIKKLAKEKYEIKKAKYNFVVVARIDEVKGYDNLVKFVKKVDEKTKDYQFVIVGSNFYFPEYSNKIKEQLKNYNVIWEGLQNNPYKYMKNADYLVQLSKFESQCMVMYESLILGTPVIVTDFRTAKETVNETNGFIVNQELSNLNIDEILQKAGTFNIDYHYNDNTEQWKKAVKLEPIKDKFLSIIIPNYNNAEWLDKCLGSLANQTYKNYETIFIDDVSTDNSLEIAKKYKDKLNMKIISLKQKRYNGGARNVGILEAKGEYTIFIDSDDWLKDNNVLANINKSIHNEDMLRLGYSLSNGVQDNLFIDIPKADTLYKIFSEDTCACWTKVIKSSILKQVLFPENTLCEDRVWHYRLIEKIRTFKNYNDYTHVWNRANKHSTTTNRTVEWECSCYKHAGEMHKFIKTTNNEQYKSFVEAKLQKHLNNLRNGVYSQL